MATKRKTRRQQVKVPAHTLLPWSYGTAGGDDYTIWHQGQSSQDMEFVCDMVPDEFAGDKCEVNAEFLTRAANAHDKLLKAARQGLAALRRLAGHSAFDDEDAPEFNGRGYGRAACGALSAAIGAATGEPG